MILTWSLEEFNQVVCMSVLAANSKSKWIPHPWMSGGKW